MMASGCCGHPLASSSSLASLSLFFRAPFSLISRSFLSISLPNCSRSSLILSTHWTEGQASWTHCPKAGNRVSVRPRCMSVSEPLELKESKTQTNKKNKNEIVTWGDLRRTKQALERSNKFLLFIRTNQSINHAIYPGKYTRVVWKQQNLFPLKR